MNRVAGQRKQINPMAVQLARLSLWLCTLAADRPLTFLDHHLVAQVAEVTGVVVGQTERVEARCAGHGLELATPRAPAERGSQIGHPWPGVVEAQTEGRR